MRTILAAVSIVLALTVSPAFAQQGQINGVVTDTTGGVMPGVTVTAVEQQTGLSRDTVSGPNGALHVSFPAADDL